VSMIRSIEFVHEENALVVELREPADVISSIPVLGENPRFIVFKTVPTNFYVDNLVDFYRLVLSRLGIDSGVVFLTSVSVSEYVREQVLSPYVSDVVVTVGLEPAVCLDVESVHKPIPGTINIAVITTAPLTTEGAIDLFKTVVEAKVLAVSEILLRCTSRSSGTVSDAIVVALPRSRPKRYLFAGIATDVGNAIAKAVYKAILSRAVTLLGVDDFLKNVLGVDREHIVELALQLYRRAPIPGLSVDRVRKILRDILDDVLRDPNVWCLLIAARELDLHAYSNSIPHLSRDEFLNDTQKILADELLGIALSLYIAGAKGMFSMYWVERLKKNGVLSFELPMFEDDVLSALLGSLLTKLYDSYRER